ncbi:hypothetical protein EDD86DRAFT_207542, partial [Gorgonomyces haynaldii]
MTFAQSFDRSSRLSTIVLSAVSLLFLFMTYVFSDLVSLIYHGVSALAMLAGIMSVQNKYFPGVVGLAVFHFLNLGFQVFIFAWDLMPEQLDALSKECVAAGYEPDCAGFLLPGNIVFVSLMLLEMLAAFVVTCRYAHVLRVRPETFSSAEFFEHNAENINIESLPQYEPKQDLPPFYVQSGDVEQPPKTHNNTNLVK